MIAFTSRFRFPSDVLVSEMDGGCVLLNLKTEKYFGLDEVGFRICETVANADSLESAYDSLREVFDIEPEVLRRDMDEIVGDLVEHGLLETVP